MESDESQLSPPLSPPRLFISVNNLAAPVFLKIQAFLFNDEKMHHQSKPNLVKFYNCLRRDFLHFFNPTESEDCSRAKLIKLVLAIKKSFPNLDVLDFLDRISLNVDLHQKTKIAIQSYLWEILTHLWLKSRDNHWSLKDMKIFSDKVGVLAAQAIISNDIDLKAKVKDVARKMRFGGYEYIASEFINFYESCKVIPSSCVLGSSV